jgi:superkiller protein 3
MASGTFVLITLIIFLVSTGVMFYLFFVKSRNIIKYNRKGLQYKDREMWEDSIRCFQRALDLDPNHALSHYNLGFVLYFGKKLADAAIVEFELAIEKNRKMAPAYYALGHVLFHSKDQLEGAVDNLNKAIELDPLLAQAYNTLGLIEIKKDNWEKALEYFRKAFSIDNTLEPACCNISIALVYQGKNTEAMEYAKKYIELNPNSTLAHNNLGNIYNSCRMKAEAVKELLISSSINPDDWQVNFWLGCLRLQLNEFKNAITSFQKVLQLQGDYALTYYNLALCYEQNNNKTLASKYIERAIELNPALGENLI